MMQQSCLLINCGVASVVCHWDVTHTHCIESGLFWCPQSLWWPTSVQPIWHWMGHKYYTQRTGREENRKKSEELKNEFKIINWRQCNKQEIKGRSIYFNQANLDWTNMSNCKMMTSSFINSNVKGIEKEILYSPNVIHLHFTTRSK